MYIVYDCEIFSNCFIVNFFLPEQPGVNKTDSRHMTFTFFETENFKENFQKLKELIDKLQYGGNYTLISFNGIHFDQPVINAFLCNEITGAYERCQDIIKTNKNYYETAIKCNELDVHTLLPRKSGSLKKIQARLGLPVVEYRGGFSKPLPKSHLEDCIKYCQNDTESTWKVFNTKDVQDVITVRKWLKEHSKYKDYIPFGINKPESQLGADIIINFLKKSQNIWKNNELKNLLIPELEFIAGDKIANKDKLVFQNNAFTKVFDSVNGHRFKFNETYDVEDKTVYYENENKLEIDIPLDDKCLLRFGEGGIHLHGNSGHFKGKFVNVDVSSQYPAIVRNLKIAPRYRIPELSILFSKLYSEILEDRLSAKASGDKIKSAALKIPLNAITGSFKSAYSPICNPASHVQIILNAQLSILKLIDMLQHSGYEIVHVNTDGVVIRHSGDAGELKPILSEWENNFNLKLEMDSFSDAIIIDTNNYCFINGNEEIKSVGRTFRDFSVTDGGVEPSIIGQAVKQYFVSGKKPEDFIQEVIGIGDIKPFLFIRGIKKPENAAGVYRYYLSNDGIDPSVPSLTSYKSKIKICNNEIPNVFPDLNMKPYLDLIYDKIRKIDGTERGILLKKAENKKMNDRRLLIKKSAEELLSLGFSVIPIVPEGKTPMIPEWIPFQGKQPSKSLITKWFNKESVETQNGIPNIAIVCGTISGINVIDIDDRKIGNVILGFVDRYKVGVVKTGKGYHIYFKFGNIPSKRLTKNIEIKGNGTYVICPDSVHPSGYRYDWIRSIESVNELTELTEDILEEIAGLSDESVEVKKPVVLKPTEVEEGNRNNSLASYTGKLLAKGIPEENINKLVKAFNDQIPEPLGDKEVDSIIKSVTKTKERREMKRDTNIMDIGFEDTHFARHLHDKYKDEFCYSEIIGGWLKYSVGKWFMNTLSADFYNAMLSEIDRVKRESKKITEPKTLEIFEKGVKSLYQCKKQDNIVKICKRIFTLPNERFNHYIPGTTMLNLKNTTISVSNGEVLNVGHSPDNYLTTSINANYNSNATCPTWYKFIESVTVKDNELAEYLQTAIGYSLMFGNPENLIFFLFGNGQNGKSTFLSVVQSIMGDLSATADLKILLGANQFDNNRLYQLAMLDNRSIVVAAETSELQKLDESSIKLLSGMDEVSVRNPYGRPYMMLPKFKLWIHGNYKPILKSYDKGISRRLRIIPFAANISDKEKDVKLREKLLAERDGIFLWMLKGLIKYQTTGITTANSVDIANKELAEDNDNIGVFLNDVYGKDWPLMKILDSVRDMTEKYFKWCDGSSEDVLPTMVFNSKMSNKGFRRVSVRQGDRVVKMWKNRNCE